MFPGTLASQPDRQPDNLMLCCGIMRHDGWVRLDADSEVQPDITATIPPLPESVMSKRWREIEWIHGPGILFRPQAKEVFEQCYLALCSGGRLSIETPDADLCAQTRNWDGLFGSQDPARPLLATRWCWTKMDIADALLAAGFRRIEFCQALYHKPWRDFRVEAVK